MLLGRKPLSEVIEEDIQELVDNKVLESRFIDYKVKLPGGSDSEKKEFLADVSSFANASGGHLVFGIREEAGIPVEISGLEITNADATVQRMENVLRDGLDPRVPRCVIRAIPLTSGKHVVLVEVGKSWASPHMVTLGGHGKFYSRNSAGKYPLDVRELRAEFTLAEAARNRVRNFRIDRLSKLVAGDTPVPIFDAPKIVLHLVPLGVGLTSQQYDLLWLRKQPERTIPMYSSGFAWRHNFDGFLSYATFQDHRCYSYLQVYRDGSLEAVESFMLRERSQKSERSIPSVTFEKKILEAIPRFLSLQRDLGVSLPIFLMLSLLGVKGYKMGVGYDYAWDAFDLIDRDSLIVPEVLIDDFSVSPEALLRPIFDIVWNAAGWPSSLNFDEGGKWREHS